MAKKVTKKETIDYQPKIIDRYISDFLNNEYKDYSKYVIATRALPSIVDGFKVGARKVMHAAFHGGLKNKQERKVLNLVGDVYNLTLFMHGDASLYGTIFTEGAEFLDNLNPLTIVGQHGSLRDPKAVSAPRYLSAKLSEYAEMIYKVDEDLIEYLVDEGQSIEPKSYFPIIPTVITSRNEGMAPGYKFKTFSYNPIHIINACEEYLKSDKITPNSIHPYTRGIKPEKFVYDAELDRWVSNGEYKVDIKNDILQITDLPYDVSFDSLEKKLNSYIDSGYIKDWRNYSHDNVIDYKIIFHKTVLNKELQPAKKAKLIKNLMLQTVLPNDLLYVLDENNKVKHFEDIYELIQYFVDLRLTKYEERKNRLIDCLNKKLLDNTNMIKFIDLVIDGTIKVSNRPIKDVQSDMIKHDIPVEYIKTPISKLTKDERDALLKRNKEIHAEIKYIEKTTTKNMYLNDLKKLNKDLEGQFD
jgi:DNA topoisomerase-2